MATILERAMTLIAQMGGLAILSATLAAATAVGYRWYVREVVPRGLSLLVGLSGVAVYLNTTTVLGEVIAGVTAPTEAEQALFNITAFLIAAGGAVVGRRIGDQFGHDVLLDNSAADVDADVGRLVKSVGRVVTVELPQNIGDVTGYDPVPEATKAKLAGRTFLFPRRLTVAELRERLVHRLKTDYAVGHVDVELAADGSVEFLALGSRAAGIGPTLPPATNAVAIRADPAFAASAGDLVQVWETDPMRRVLTAELRGVADETVTIAIDAADTPKVDPNKEYRLVTLPVTDRPDREFASLLRAADETFSSVTVEAGSPLHGLPVGGLDITVVAIEPEGGTPSPLPEPTAILAPGDTIFAIARPDALRRLEEAAEPLDPSLVRQPKPTGHRKQSSPEPHEEPAATADTTTQTDTEQASTTDDQQEGDSDQPAGDETPPPANDSEAEPSTAGGQAGSDSFAELKSEFETGDADWEETDDDGESDEDDGVETDEPAAGDGETDSSDVGKADAGTFDELKSEFETGDADWEQTDENGQSDQDEEIETSGVEADGADTQNSEAELRDKAGAETFEEFKSEFETGDPDWADEESSTGQSADDDGTAEAFDTADESDSSGDETEPEGDGEDDLETLDIDSDDGGEDDLETLDFEDDEDGEDDDLSSLGFDENDDSEDDLDTLGFESDGEDEDSLGSLDDGEGLTLDEDDDESEDSEDDDSEDDDDDDGSAGASSFQQLKEEFESGDADWEDDISDSPGGDMRLDE